MQNDYDAAKWQINLEKHGVDFLAHGSVFKDLFRIEWRDERRASGEERWICQCSNGFRLYLAVNTIRVDRLKITSARRANDRKQQNYSDSNI